MKMQQLKCFLAVVQYNSFSLGADSLFMTQSALSKQILALEKELGVTLFDRRTHTLKITSEGEQLYAHALLIISEYNKLLMSLKHMRDSSAKTIRICAPNDMAHYGITDMLISFEKANSEYSSEVFECSHVDMPSRLENHLTDIAIGYKEFFPWKDNFLLTSLCQDSIGLVVRSDSLLAEWETVSLKEAEDEIFCLPRSSTSFFRLFQNLCNAACFTPNLNLSDVRYSTIKRYIQHGMYITVTTKLRAKSFYSEPELVFVPLKNTKTLTFSILTRKEALNTVDAAFLKFAMDYYRQKQ